MRHIGHIRRIFHIGEIVIVDMFVLLVELMIANSMAIFVLLDTGFIGQNGQIRHNGHFGHIGYTGQFGPHNPIRHVSRVD